MRRFHHLKPCGIIHQGSRAWPTQPGFAFTPMLGLAVKSSLKAV